MSCAFSTTADAAKLVDRHLEGDARPSRWLLENHGKHGAGGTDKRLWRLARLLQRGGGVEMVRKVARVQGVEIEKMRWRLGHEGRSLRRVSERGLGKRILDGVLDEVSQQV